MQRIKYEGIEVGEITFSFDVPKNIRFYSAHFKIDVFKYLASLADDEYSILLDNDIVCFSKFSEEFTNVINDGEPVVYHLNSYGGNKKLSDVSMIVDKLCWIPWVGGEFIGGTCKFYSELYQKIITIKDKYWAVVNNGLFHVGDEMLTSIAVCLMRDDGICPLDAKWFGAVHRYWSVTETRNPFSYPISLIHFPGDKIFFKNVNLQATTIKGLMQGYWCWWKFQRCKQIIRSTLKFIT